MEVGVREIIAAENGDRGTCFLKHTHRDIRRGEAFGHLSTDLFLRERLERRTDFRSRRLLKAQRNCEWR